MAAEDAGLSSLKTVTACTSERAQEHPSDAVLANKQNATSKRARGGSGSRTSPVPNPGGAPGSSSPSTSCCSAQLDCKLLQLPGEVLELVLSLLDASTLASLTRCCRALRARDKASGLTLADKVARDMLIRLHGGTLELAQRWRWVSPVAGASLPRD